MAKDHGEHGYDGVFCDSNFHVLSICNSNSRKSSMDLKPFKLDIDELINEFAEGGFTKLTEMKKIWVSRKFSFIFEASPTTNQACFMQSLFAHSMGYMVAENSLSHRLGGLYCLYCLFETQPFKPPFKIYLSLEWEGGLKRLKNLVIDAKQKDLGLVCALVKHMLQKNLFLFGFVDMTDGSTGRVNELTAVQNARVQVAYKKLFTNTQIEDFIHMDLGMELDVGLLKRKSSSYAAAKELAVREAGEVVDVGNIKHTTQNTQLIGDIVEKTAEEWNMEKELFYQQTGISHPQSEEQEANRPFKQQKYSDSFTDNENGSDIRQEEGYEDVDEQDGNEGNDNFGMELEEALLYEYENEEPNDIDDVV